MPLYSEIAKLNTSNTTSSSMQGHPDWCKVVGDDTYIHKEDENRFYRAGYNDARRGCAKDWYPERNRTEVDRNTTGKKLPEIFGSHRSEKGWFLPQNHPRHLFNFPIDIFIKILSFALVAQYEVTPQTPREYSPTTSYSISLDGNFHVRQTVLCQIEGIDFRHKNLGNGQYETKKYFGYFRRPIDATLLRVSKVFHKEGLPLLYGENKFLFNLNKYNKYYSPPWGVADREEIRSSMGGMMSIKELDLPWSLYFDPFARFLHSIGSKNASFIRKLRFIGALFPTLDEYWGVYDDNHEKSILNIGNYLTAYMPLIPEHCPNLMKFALGFTCFVERDWYVVEPEDEEMQDGDELFDEIILKDIRESRKKNRLAKQATALSALMELENTMALNLKPIIDTFVVTMRKLRVLEVKSSLTTVDQRSGISEMASWTDMEMANEAKHALAIAVFNRSQETEVGKEMAGPAPANTEAEEVSTANTKDHADSVKSQCTER